ncbi:hypothetical protein SAMN04515647_1684 [Cohaesibacter sp. ES.047]|uniref:GPW/gp25 family protein n=1 Tax=Cohaesibacter sp. ES.047 TaxID=1798205 RepID=UPI000BB70D1A|nr:phage baseplate protein [Cohaesibacter sp. ES.047]SNY91463.1 hypothetical protein SAMN04515647_1684 [Cohaesibacter sp. ES.047]
MVQIDYLHWQHKVTLGANAAWGEIAVGLDDLHQAVRIIVLTPKRSVPTEPEKFCDALDYIDRPPAVAIPAIKRAVWDAITLWEPRIVLDGIEAEMVDLAHYAITISWHPVEGVLKEIQRTKVLLQEAA